MFEIKDQVIPGLHRILDVYKNEIFVAQATRTQSGNKTFWYPIAKKLAEVPPRARWDDNKIKIIKGITICLVESPILDLETMTTAEVSAVIMKFILTIEQIPTMLT